MERLFELPAANPQGQHADAPWVMAYSHKTQSFMKNGGQQKCLDKALAVTIMLNNEEIGKHSGKITKIKPFINKYIWEGINFPPEKDDWKKFEKSNLTIVLNVLCAEKEKHILHMFQNKTQIMKNVETDGIVLQ